MPPRPAAEIAKLDGWLGLRSRCEVSYRAVEGTMRESFVVAAVLIAGCTTAGPTVVKQRATAQVNPAERDKVYARAGNAPAPRMDRRGLRQGRWLAHDADDGDRREAVRNHHLRLTEHATGDHHRG